MPPGLDITQGAHDCFRHLRLLHYQITPEFDYLIDMLHKYRAMLLARATGGASPDFILGYHLAEQTLNIII
jgi:hypothetical protein